MAHGFQALTRSPDSTTDWSRPQLYAPFIQSLGCSQRGHNSYVIDDSIYCALATSNLERPILPRLNRLVWHSNGIQDDDYIDLFLGPQLTSLQLVFSQESALRSVQARSLTSLGHSSPNVNSIYIALDVIDVNREPRYPLRRAMSDLICGLRGLKEVTARIPLDREAVLHLAASSCVRLNIQNDPRDVVATIAGSVPSPFPELVALTLPSYNFADVLQLIKLLNPEKLQHIAVYGARESPLLIPAFMNFSIQPAFFLSALAPLFTFKNIIHLDISTIAITFDLDDDDVKQIAIAWPRLQHVSLWSIPAARPVQSRVTLASMVTLVKHCHELQKIELAIHIDAVDFTLLSPEGANDVIRNEKITALHMRVSSIAPHVNHGAIIDFFLRLFPQLAAFHWTHPTRCWRDWLSIHRELRGRRERLPRESGR